MGAFPICVDNEGGYGLLSCHKKLEVPKVVKKNL